MSKAAITMLGALLVIAIAFSLTATAQHADLYEVLLLPIAFDSSDAVVPGAHGSIWTGELWLRNDTTDTVRLVPSGSDYPPGVSIARDLTTWRSSTMLFLPKEEARSISLNARMFEVSRGSQPQGVEVPLVRRSEFRTDAVSLLGVPVSSRGRITLRVFDPFPDFDPAVYEIEVMDKDEDLIGAAVLASEHDPSLFTQPGEPLGQGRPGSAIMHDLREVLAHPGYEGRIHVRVRPLGSRPFWPMISITDNETQHVLIVTPQ